jgi:hypothetical protein
MVISLYPALVEMLCKCGCSIIDKKEILMRIFTEKDT